MTEKVQIRRVGERIEAKIPYIGGDGPVAAKSVAGYKWNNATKTWSYPLSWDSATGLRKASKSLGLDLVISEGLKAWGQQEKERRQRLASIDRNSSTVIDLPRVRELYPKIWDALSSRPFQTAGVRFGVETGSFLLADDPGLGKTLQTIALMIESEVRGPILVVANKSAATISWPNEIAKWAPHDRVVQFGAHIPAAKRDQLIADLFAEYESEDLTPKSQRTWVVMNPHWIRLKAELDDYGKYVYDKGGVKIQKATVPELFFHTWAGIVADESHETLATNTGNAKKWSQQRQGLGALVTTGPKVSISGTPMRGKPENMFGHLNWIDGKKYRGYWPWAKRNFYVTETGFGGAMELGSLRDPDSFYRELEPIMLRRVKSEVAADLPPKQYGGTPHPSGDVVGVWLPLEKDQKKQYDNFVKTNSIEDAGGNTLSATGILAIYTRMKQLANTSASVGTREVRGEDGAIIDEDYFVPALPSNKYEWLKEWLMERDLLGKDAKGTGKVIVASQFRQTIDLFRENLEANGTPSFAITGETPAENRVAYQNAFQNDPDSHKLFFLQSVAGGTSLTLDMADDVIILDEMWDPDKQTQIEDRAHRLSRKHNVTIWYTRSLETIEEYIGTTVDERMNTCRSVLDGARGVEVAKKLMRK